MTRSKSVQKSLLGSPPGTRSGLRGAIFRSHTLARRQGKVRAILGPTNTGKTHLALERMLGHGSGIMGFPLRLLAREVYDRAKAIKGSNSVALITGEQRIEPPSARYYFATVEAMPLDRPVEFVAIDEVQLATDHERGHIFTDRILHARGLSETLLLGAGSMGPTLRHLLPDIEIETRPRLSRLTYSGYQKLSRLPPRSAVVAFTMNRVYALAEQLRQLSGGVALVLGALSPQTRNSQVDLFQSGEVDHLVATDAIGMGLNLDLDRVSFSTLQKYDGTRVRPLMPEEIGQIAGRAGRNRNDGTFGTTDQLTAMPETDVAAVLRHTFPPVRTVNWRHRDLVFSSVDALMESLAVPPRHSTLVLKRDGLDQILLRHFSREPTAMSRISGQKDVQLLWALCQAPDFQCLGVHHHLAFLLPVFEHLIDHGRIERTWLESRIIDLNRSDGTIDILLERMQQIRSLAYLACRRSWVEDSSGLQELARSVEDRLSDCLHQRLLRRFVDRRAVVLLRSRLTGEEPLAGVRSNGDVVVEGQMVGRIRGFRYMSLPLGSVGSGDNALVQATRKAAARAVRLERVRREMLMLERGQDDEFSLDPGGRILWNGEVIGKLERGAQLHRPDIRLLRDTGTNVSIRQKLERRVRAFVDARILRVLPGLRTENKRQNPAERSVRFALQEGLGCVSTTTLGLSVADLGKMRRRLLKLGVRSSQGYLWIERHQKPEALNLRLLLAMIFFQRVQRNSGSGTDRRADAESGKIKLPVIERAVSLHDLPESIASNPARLLQVGLLRLGPWAVPVQVLDAARRTVFAHRRSKSQTLPAYTSLCAKLSEQLGLGRGDLVPWLAHLRVVPPEAQPPRGENSAASEGAAKNTKPNRGVNTTGNQASRNLRRNRTPNAPKTSPIRQSSEELEIRKIWAEAKARAEQKEKLVSKPQGERSARYAEKFAAKTVPPKIIKKNPKSDAKAGAESLNPRKARQKAAVETIKSQLEYEGYAAPPPDRHSPSPIFRQVLGESPGHAQGYAAGYALGDAMARALGGSLDATPGTSTLRSKVKFKGNAVDGMTHRTRRVKPRTANRSIQQQLEQQPHGIKAGTFAAALDQADLRIDLWLFRARFFKSRTLASVAVWAGRVRLRGYRARKASATVRPGDDVVMRFGSKVRHVRIVYLPMRRGPASEAVQSYVES